MQVAKSTFHVPVQFSAAQHLNATPTVPRAGAPRVLRLAARLLLATLFVAPALRAEATPDDVRQAAENFNRGRDAFKQNDFATAADHFEKADDLVPNAKVLRLAIDSRSKAGQGDRAATLIALALRLYPDDASFSSYSDVLREAIPRLGKLRVDCGEPCTVLIGTRLVHGPAARKHTIFLRAGDYQVKVFWGEKAADAQSLVADAGATTGLSFQPPDSPAEPAAGAREQRPVEDDDWGSPTLAKPTPKVDIAPEMPEQHHGKPLKPVVFWIGVAATAGLAGVSIWSGVDAANNPGKAKVEQNCAGLGSSCPEYRLGIEKQRRTNILWGATAGVGVITVLLGTVFTEWGASKSPKPALAGLWPASGPKLTPTLWLGPAIGLGARGEF